MNISVNRLRPGMVLKEPIYVGNNKIPYIRHGEVLTEKIIEKIMEIPELTSIAVTFDEISNKMAKETVSSEIKDIAKHAIKSRDINATVKSAQIIASNILASNKYSYNLLRYILEEVTAEDTTLNIVEFSVAFAKIYNEHGGNVDLNEIAIAAMLHNIGIYYRNHVNEIQKLKKINLSKETFPKFDKKAFEVKDKSEYSYAYESVYAYSLINDYTSISQNSKVAILLQRENNSGTGPLGYRLDKVNNKAKTMAQIIQIAGLYERLIETACKDEEKTPADVFNGLKIAAIRGMIDKRITAIITRYMELYPVGTRVVLNDGTVGEVIETTITPEKPKIKVESAINGVTSIYDDGFFIDLNKAPNLKIMSVYDFGLKSTKKVQENKQTM